MNTTFLKLNKSISLAVIMCCLFLVELPNVWAYKIGVTKIPNGDKNSCLNCHQTMNEADYASEIDKPMKLDFNATTPAVRLWTDQLANKDSDGDGFTNGEELQDPNRDWVRPQPKNLNDYMSADVVMDPKDPSLLTGVYNYVSNPSVASSYPPLPTLYWWGVRNGTVIGNEVFGISIGPSTLTSTIASVRFVLRNASNNLKYHDQTDTSPPFCFVPDCSRPWDGPTPIEGNYFLEVTVTDKRATAQGGARSVFKGIGVTYSKDKVFSGDFDLWLAN